MRQMKRTLIALLFSLAGLLNVYAQTGNVYRKFYMQTPEQVTPDTLLATVSINDGKLSRLDITIPCLDKGVSIVGGLDLKRRPNACSELTDMLKTIKEKYHEWTLIAKNNNIKKYSKEIGQYKNTPALYLYARKDYDSYSPVRQSIQNGSPYFEVDSNGKCSIYMAWINIPFERIVGFSKVNIMSKPITEILFVKRIYFSFLSEAQIQSMIDALNIETAIEEVRKRQVSLKDIDALFK